MIMKAYVPRTGVHAEVGDQIVVGGPTVGRPGRDGEVIDPDAVEDDEGEI
ncbi:DUF1918 domain-containing protein [Streptomyces nojiriensis]